MLNYNKRMEIGDRIRKVRLNAGLFQTGLAKAIGVSRGLIGQWEAHIGKPGRDKLEKLSALTGVSIDYLLGISEDAMPNGTTVPPDAAQLLSLWPQLSPRQRRSHLELIRESISLRHEMEQEGSPADRKPVGV